MEKVLVEIRWFSKLLFFNLPKQLISRLDLPSDHKGTFVHEEKLFSAEEVRFDKTSFRTFSLLLRCSYLLRT